MDYTDITYEIEKIQSSIRELQNLIKRSYDGKFDDGKQVIHNAAVADADNAYESLEQTKSLCDVLSDAYNNIKNDNCQCQYSKRTIQMKNGNCLKIT